MDEKDHSVLQSQDVRFETKPEQVVPVPPIVPTETKPKKTIPTRLGLLVILLTATIAGSGVWWYAFSYNEPEPINVDQIIMQMEARRSAAEATTTVATTTADSATSTMTTTTAPDGSAAGEATSSKPSKLSDVKLRILTPEGGETLCLGQDYTIRWEGPKDLSTVGLYFGGWIGYGIGPLSATRNESNSPGTGEFVWKVGFREDGKDQVLTVGEVYVISITGHFPLSSGKEDVVYELDKPISVEDCRG